MTPIKPPKAALGAKAPLNIKAKALPISEKLTTKITNAAAT